MVVAVYYRGITVSYCSRLHACGFIPWLHCHYNYTFQLVVILRTAGLESGTATLGLEYGTAGLGRDSNPAAAGQDMHRSWDRGQGFEL